MISVITVVVGKVITVIAVVIVRMVGIETLSQVSLHGLVPLEW